MLDVATRGLGIALPEQVVTSAEVAERLGLTEDWIVSRTGIRERRWLREDESLADLATLAARRALNGATPDLVIVATCSPDDLLPALAVTVAERVGASAGFDVNAACTGFLLGLQLAAAQIESGRAESVLVIGAERLSRLIDPADKQTAALFADGAGALLVTEPRLGPVLLRSEDRRDLLFADRTSGRITMAGSDVFKHAVNRMSEAALAVADPATIDRFVLHQANGRITKAVARRLDVDPVDCIETVGNVSAASLPIALAEANPQPGERILLAAFGAGFVWGAGVLTW
jgi:3-oxoacyl-[acyl-carrier-protein] synthase-3